MADAASADLRHHGDGEAGAGPARLRRQRVRRAAAGLARRRPARQPRRGRRLPDRRRRPRRPSPPATRADRDEVLATAGAAEAFTLVARLRPWRRPVVVHPQFTEPHAALVQAGHDGHRGRAAATPLRARPGAGPGRRRPGGGRQPDQPDRRPAPGRHAPRRWSGPGGLVVVDEAFMDAVPGEPESLAGEPRAGAGRPAQPHQALGHPRRPRRLPAGRAATWSPSCGGLQSAVVGLDDGRRRDARLLDAGGRRPRPRAAPRRSPAGARHLETRPGRPRHRARPVRRRRSCWPGSGRACTRRCAAAGIAVRRADTFPGLDAAWVRIAVRPHGC